MNEKTSSALVISFAILCFAGSAGFFLWVTARGIGIGSDSLSYIGSANKLLENITSIQQLTPHFPPVYPILLALAGSIGGDVVTSARWLHAFLYGANAVLIGLSIYFSTRRNLLSMLLGILVFVSSRAVIIVHTYAWSESLFIFFSLLAYLLFTLYLLSSKYRYLVFSSLLIGLAVATRYIGAALVPPLVMGLFLFSNEPLRLKIRGLFTLLILSAAPAAAWVLRNVLLFHSAANRTLVYHPRGGLRTMLRQLIELFHSYVFAVSNASKYIQAAEMGVLALILLGLAAVLLRRRVFNSTPDRFGALTITLGFSFAVVYVCLVVFSIFFVDAATSINDRIILPAYVFLIISVISLVFLFSAQQTKFPVWLGFTAAIALSIIVWISPTYAEASDLHAHGIGFNSVVWTDSLTIRLIKNLHPGNEIFSNAGGVIELLTGLPEHELPRMYASTTLVENQQFEEQLAGICDQVTQGKAIIVILENIGRDYFPTEYEVQIRCHLPVLYDTEDGVLLGETIGE